MRRSFDAILIPSYVLDTRQYTGLELGFCLARAVRTSRRVLSCVDFSENPLNPELFIPERPAVPVISNFNSADLELILGSLNAKGRSRIMMLRRVAETDLFSSPGMHSQNIQIFEHGGFVGDEVMQALGALAR